MFFAGGVNFNKEFLFLNLGVEGEEVVNYF